MATCQGCQSNVRSPLKPTCSGCGRQLILCRTCYAGLNDETTDLAALKYHCSRYCTSLVTRPKKPCDASVAMRWNLPGEDPEALKKKKEQELKELAEIQKAIEARRDSTPSTRGVGSASQCATAKERLTIERQVTHLESWKKRPCSCTPEHAIVLDRGQGRLVSLPKTLKLEERKKLYAGFSTFAMRRIMQIHKICTPTGSSESALKLKSIRGIYLNGTVCVTVLEKGGQVKFLLTENVAQTSSNFLCTLKMPDEWVHEPDPIRYASRDKKGQNYYLHRMCAKEGLKKPKNDSSVTASCTSKHASAEIDGPVHIHDDTHEDGYSLHHAEMQAVHYAFRFGWNILAMAPSRPCCALCAGTLEGLGLMPIVRHPHEWGFGAGTGYQKLSDWSDDGYLKLPGALKSLDIKAIAERREALRRHDPAMLTAKRKRNEKEEEDEETGTEDKSESGMEGLIETDEAEVIEKLEKKQKLFMISTVEKVNNTLMSLLPEVPKDQISALLAMTPLVEVCEVPSLIKLPDEFLSFFEGFEYGADLQEQAGHAPREVLGITNTGNSCYLNSLLQLLIHTNAVTGLDVAIGAAPAESLGALLLFFGTTYFQQAGGGTYIEESDTCYYTTGLVDDLRTVLYEAHVIGGMYSQEDALLALEHILQAHGLTFQVQVTKRYHLDFFKQVAAYPDVGSNADNNGNVVTLDTRGLLRLSLEGQDATGRTPAVALAAVLDANWNWNYGLGGVATDTRVNNQGIVYQNVNLLQETWAWPGGVAPNFFFLALDRFFYRLGAAGKNQAKVAVPLQLARWGKNYSLYGFLVHTGGSVHGGHYVSYIRSPSDHNFWYEIDDRYVYKRAYNAAEITAALAEGSGYFYGP